VSAGAVSRWATEVVHVLRRAPALLVAAVLEGLALVAAVWGAWLLALALHLGAAVAAGPGLGGTRLDARFYAASVVAALPGLGLVGLVGVKLMTRARPPGELFASVHEALANLPEPERPRDSLDRVLDWLQQQVSVQPLADVINGGDPKLQRWAVELLERRGDEHAVELLRAALGAQSHEVQVLASAALERLEGRLTDAVGRARERAARDAGSAAAHEALGRACAAYAASGMAEPVVARRWYLEAEGALRRAIELDARAAPGLQPALGRAVLGQGRHAEAEALARAASDMTPSRELDVLLAEALYAQGRWRDLAAASEASAAAGRADGRLAWWAGQDPEPVSGDVTTAQGRREAGG